MDWNGKKVLVLGLGDTGLSMARWLAAQGARVSVVDSRPYPPHAAALSAELPDVTLATGSFDAKAFGGVDAIAISPGIDPRQSPIAETIRRGLPVVGDIELFAQGMTALALQRALPRPKVIGITGSNGKSTVTAMAGEASRAAGCSTVVAGNIGLPVLDALARAESGEPLPEVFVLELSSFQLESTRSLAADAATVLNVTEDHLDRYDSMDDYAAAKARIFEGGGVQVLNRQDARSMAMARSGRTIATFGLDAPRSAGEWGLAADLTLARGADGLMPVSELPVAGLHNAANALAALALGDALGLPVENMIAGLRRFQGLPHRLQKVVEINGVAFYDDSKGTNVGATVAALNGMSAPVVLIAGGDGKGQDFRPLAEPVAAHARAVVLLGRDADAIAHVLEDAPVALARANGMEEAVETAYRASRPGDAVLLSPACASYDMFRSYVHRGEVFVGAVRALAEREGEARE
ncbi:MAG: UDP-N-acetylmuramoyl-L-alanine--D-glutamate ligase [Burkholderiales bacterium]